ELAVSLPPMWRYLLVFVFVFQALQMGLASAHVTAEAAHAVAHGHADSVPADLELSPTCDHCQLDGRGHPCHDNHSHHSTVVGLGSEHPFWLDAAATGLHRRAVAEALPAGAFSRIEKPKWHTTTPVVVNL
ncbi:MAG: hypothetical protein V4562_08505, partial [Pseudomonadota bacterium]